MPWQDGDSYVCPHCNRECIIYRRVPQDLVTKKRHTCDQYKRFKKTQLKSSLSETFSAHSTDRGGILVEVPYRGSGRWVRKKWRDEFGKYMTDEVYEANKNMPLFIAKRQKPMSEYFIPHDKEAFDYDLDNTKKK